VSLVAEAGDKEDGAKDEEKGTPSTDSAVDLPAEPAEDTYLTNHVIVEDANDRIQQVVRSVFDVKT